MNRILVDTDIAVDYLRGTAAAVAFIQAHEAEIAFSAVTVAELYARVRNGEEKSRLGTFIDLFPVLPVDRDIAETAGLYRRDFGPSHGTGLADGMIAATAQSRGLELKTLNTRHYPMIPALSRPYEPG